MYKGLYKNIDLKVYGLEKQVEYDWLVKPGGNPADIRFKYETAKGSRIDTQGNLLVDTGFGELMHKKPYAYQESEAAGAGISSAQGREHKTVEAVFKKIGKNTYGFEVGEYDTRRELVIDPVVMAYSTYIGATDFDHGCSVAVDAAGYVYVTGCAMGADFPLLDAYQGLHGGEFDAYLLKLDTGKSGAAGLMYSTYLGGTGWDYGLHLAADDLGNVYIAGNTDSADFPLRNEFQTIQSGMDVFVVKLDTTTSGDASLLYSTILGGEDEDWPAGIALDAGGNVYVGGQTMSSNYPVLNQFQGYQAGLDGFITRLNPSLSGAASLIYSTYFGGSAGDGITDIALDENGITYVAGMTNSTDFSTLNQYQGRQGEIDAFVSKIDTNIAGASGLLYSTYLGGALNDKAKGIVVRDDENVHVVGYTRSTDFPQLNPLQGLQGGDDCWFAGLDTTTSEADCLLYSTYFGGNDRDWPNVAVVDDAGCIHVAGYSFSEDFPVLNELTGSRGFVLKYQPVPGEQPRLIYSSLFDGGSSASCLDIAVDGEGNIYAIGSVSGDNHPTINPFQSNQDDYDGFLTKLYFSDGGGYYYVHGSS
ncbi:MAG: hypothetical protein GY765_12055 [bacterium]|nr:hypothetical protein [bacterium]